MPGHVHVRGQLATGGENKRRDKDNGDSRRVFLSSSIHQLFWAKRPLKKLIYIYVCALMHIIHTGQVHSIYDVINCYKQSISPSRTKTWIHVHMYVVWMDRQVGNLYCKL